MSSWIKQLSDKDREEINHAIRRDALTDAQIWAAIVARMPKEAKAEAEALKDTAGAQAVKRYRDSADFQAWKKRWLDQDLELARTLAAQRQRYELIRDLVGDDANGFEAVSKQILARGLTLAAELNDEDFKAAMGSKGFAKAVAQLGVAMAKDKARRDLESLKAEMQRMLNAPREGGDVKADLTKLVGKVDEIMGLKA